MLAGSTWLSVAKAMRSGSWARRKSRIAPRRFGSCARAFRPSRSSPESARKRSRRYGRRLAYDEPAIGYFSPDRYVVAEGRAGWNRTPAPWGWRLLAGVGAQWVGSGSDAQEEWRFEARLIRQLGDASTIEAWGGYTNAAVSSTTGAYRFTTAGLMGRIGL